MLGAPAPLPLPLPLPPIGGAGRAPQHPALVITDPSSPILQIVAAGPRACPGRRKQLPARVPGRLPSASQMRFAAARRWPASCRTRRPTGDPSQSTDARRRRQHSRPQLRRTPPTQQAARPATPLLKQSMSLTPPSPQRRGQFALPPRLSVPLLRNGKQRRQRAWQQERCEVATLVVFHSSSCLTCGLQPAQ